MSTFEFLFHFANRKAQDGKPRPARTTSFEPPRGKTNNVVSEQVQQKLGCTSIEAGKKLEILELSRGGIVLSE